VIGLTIIGLVIGVFVSALFRLLSSFNNGVGIRNEVQVSGTVSITQTGTIEFDTFENNTTIRVRASGSIVNGSYSVSLVGGQSYNVTVSYGEHSEQSYSIYVPLGVTTFTANFQSSHAVQKTPARP
jgi:hypothetical protein